MLAEPHGLGNAILESNHIVLLVPNMVAEFANIEDLVSLVIRFEVEAENFEDIRIFSGHDDD